MSEVPVYLTEGMMRKRAVTHARAHAHPRPYRGTSLISNCSFLGPYSA